MIDYSPLWDTMERKGYSQYRLLYSGIDGKTLYNIRHGKNINILTIEKLCLILNCTPNEIFRVLPNPPASPEPVEPVKKVEDK